MTGQAAIRKLLYSMIFGATVSACIFVTIAPAQDRIPDYSAIISAPDRTEADLQTDKRRDPLKLLAFTGVRPGMKVLEAAGFKLVAEGDFWRHPEDPRDFSIQPPSGRAVDEFALKFQKM